VCSFEGQVSRELASTHSPSLWNSCRKAGVPRLALFLRLPLLGSCVPLFRPSMSTRLLYRLGLETGFLVPFTPSAPCRTLFRGSPLPRRDYGFLEALGPFPSSSFGFTFLMLAASVEATFLPFSRDTVISIKQSEISGPPSRSAWLHSIFLSFFCCLLP